MKDKLNPTEQKTLNRHERAIRAARKAWLAIGLALAAILDGRLYRASHRSFEAYAEDRWELSRRRAYQFVDGARVAERLTAAGLPAPECERHARPLTKLDAADAERVWRAVLAPSGDVGQVTAERVTYAVKEIEEGRRSQDTESGGRLFLSAEAEAEIAAAREAATTGRPRAAAPLVAVPPPSYDGAPDGSGPVLVPARHVAGALDLETIHDLRDAFEAHYRAAGKRGPTLNPTNEHVGWTLWTLNPTTGCTWDCPFCYAREIAELRYPQGFAPTVHPERLLAPANTRIPEALRDDPAARRVFLGSQTDWMDPSFGDDVIQAELDMCRANPEWEFLTLTKQPARLKDFEFPPNVWVGVTVTRQGQVRAMEEALAEVEAAVRWVSFEPLHGSVALSRPELIDLFVIGAERKTAQRKSVKATEAAWVDALRLQARAVGAAVWEKDNLRVHLREMPEPRR